ncbi:MAG: hypothetical protein AAB787_02055 [Patescibacteria group bacterium]
MNPKGQSRIDSCRKKILDGPEEELRGRISHKARNAVQVEREREKKKTPQMRRWNGQAWAGIFALAAKNVTLTKAATMFEDLRVVVIELRRDGYDAEADWYLEGEDEDRLYVAGIRFLSLLKRSEQAPE